MRKRSGKNFEIEFFELTPEELDRRVHASYPDFYLMIIGLAQALAAGFLVGNIIQIPAVQELALSGHWPDGSVEISAEVVALAIRFLISLVLIVIVTYEYVYPIAMFRRYPRYADIVFPLLLGLSEVLSINFIYQMEVWWLMNAICTIAGIFSWWHTSQFSSLNLRRGTRAAGRTNRHLLLNILITMLATAVCLNAFRLERSESLSFEWELYHYLVYFAVGVALILRGRRFLDALRHDLVVDAEKSMGR